MSRATVLSEDLIAEAIRGGATGRAEIAAAAGVPDDAALVEVIADMVEAGRLTWEERPGGFYCGLVS